MSETGLSQSYDIGEECFLLNILATEQLERKVSVCHQLLAVANIIEPGLTRIRGELNHLATVLIQTPWLIKLTKFL